MVGTLAYYTVTWYSFLFTTVCTNDNLGTKCKTCEDEGKCTECNKGYYEANDECASEYKCQIEEKNQCIYI